MIGSAVYARLANFAGLTALVGDRIYPIRAPQNVTLPYVVYAEQAPIDESPNLEDSGGLLTSRVQVDAWGTTAKQAAQVGDQARKALRDFSGTVGGIAVQNIRADGGFDDADTDVEPVLYRRSRDYLVTTLEQEA